MIFHILLHTRRPANRIGEFPYAGLSFNMVSMDASKQTAFLLAYTSKSGRTTICTPYFNQSTGNSIQTQAIQHHRPLSGYLRNTVQPYHHINIRLHHPMLHFGPKTTYPNELLLLKPNTISDAIDMAKLIERKYTDQPKQPFHKTIQ